MKLGALSVVVVFTAGLSACTTVDLSQVAIQSESVTAAAPEKQNVVQRASASLTSKFRSKGWCSGGPQEKTQTATSVLLNGVDATPVKNQNKNISFASADHLAAELASANEHVVQTTKAAEVYLSISDNSTNFDSELSLLETALLSAKEAEIRFGRAVATTQNSSATRNYELLRSSVKLLKAVTDSYGDRARQSIATQAVNSRS